MQFLVWFYGVAWLDSDGGSFLMTKGGSMYNLQLGQINHSLIKAMKIVGACKRMVGPKSEAWTDLLDIDREVRAAAAECQRVLKLIDEDKNRPLVSGQKKEG